MGRLGSKIEISVTSDDIRTRTDETYGIWTQKRHLQLFISCLHERSKICELIQFDSIIQKGPSVTARFPFPLLFVPSSLPSDPVGNRAVNESGGPAHELTS